MGVVEFYEAGMGVEECRGGDAIGGEAVGIVEEEIA